MRRVSLSVCLISLVCLLIALSTPGMSASNATVWYPPANTTDYSYDDMSQKYDIEFFSTFWIGRPIPQDNLWTAWLNKTFNINLTFTTGTPVGAKVKVRGITGDAPDIANLPPSEISDVLSLTSEGIMINDWRPYLKYLPTMSKMRLDPARRFVVTDDKNQILAMPKPTGNPENWCWFIRKDWLEKLHLSMPKTDTQLLNVLTAFAKKDPDGNGIADTYGITSNGSGLDIGGQIEALLPMYGDPDVRLVKGKVYTAQNERKKLLQFIQKLIKAGAIDPDWYTQNHDSLMKKLASQRFGLIYGPADWIGGLAVQHKLDYDWQKKWTPLYPVKGDNGRSGGKWLCQKAGPEAFLMVSVKAAKDTGKMKRIMHMLDALNFPNEGFWLVRYGVHSKGSMSETTKFMKYGDLLYLNWAGTIPFSNAKDLCLADFGNPWADARDNVVSGFSPEPDDKVTVIEEWTQTILNKIDRYATNNRALLPPAPVDIVAGYAKFRVQNEIAFIMGDKPWSEWNAYQAQALKIGYSKILAHYQVQLERMEKILNPSD